MAFSSYRRSALNILRRQAEQRGRHNRVSDVPLLHHLAAAEGRERVSRQRRGLSDVSRSCISRSYVSRSCISRSYISRSYVSRSYVRCEEERNPSMLLIVG